MRWQGMGAILPLLIAMSCGDKPQTATPRSATDRGFEPDETTSLERQARPVDWSRSAGVFIGVQQFHDDSDLEVPFAADDAVDLAWLFTHELNLLPPERTALLLAGRPSKDDSRRNLAAMRHRIRLLEDDRSAAAQRECLNAETIAAIVREQARSVGPDGILIVSFATHGLSHAGEHRLLTAEASSSTPRGVVLARIIETIEAERPQRLLLLIDACRNAPREGVPWAASSPWQPRLPATFLEDVRLSRLSYAALVSAVPGTTALAADGNGLFTRAILGGLRCNASSRPDGYVTLSNLATYVSESVQNLSHGYQQPESRIGGLGPLQLARCRPEEQCAGEILSPRSGANVESRGFVRLRIDQPELFATILVCSTENNVCYNQNPNDEPLLTDAGDEIEIAVQYGGTGSNFKVCAALTADREFLRGVHEPPANCRSQDANRRVHWCGPVDVTRKPQPSRGKKR